MKDFFKNPILVFFAVWGVVSITVVIGGLIRG